MVWPAHIVSFSVFDSYFQLAKWADTIWLFPTGNDQSVRSWLHPLITAPHILLCAVKAQGLELIGLTRHFDERIGTEELYAQVVRFKHARVASTTP